MDNDRAKELASNAIKVNNTMLGMDLEYLRADAGYLLSILDTVAEEQTLYTAYLDMCDIMLKDMNAKITIIRERMNLHESLLGETID